MAKILVVDDERSVCQAFEEILSSKGHAVVSVRGGEDAMGFLQKDDCDLVILDICLPGMNGLDALGRIKQRRPKLPVIVMTGRGTTDTAIEATKRGAFDYQLKPFEPAEMLRTIAKAIEGARLMKGDVALGPETAASSAEAIVGRSAAMQQLYKAIGRSGPDRGHRAHSRRVGHGQRARSPGDLPVQPAKRQAVDGCQLRGHPRDPAGKRASGL